MPAGPSVFTQSAFRGRNDDGTETTATWKAAADTVWDQPVDETFRLRFVAQRDAKAGASNGRTDLYVSHNGGTFETVSSAVGTSPVIEAASGNITQGDDTTQQLGSGNFLVLNAGVATTKSGYAVTDAATWLGGDAVEADIEFTLQIVGSKVVPGDTLAFRMRFIDDVYTGGYDSEPILTVPEGGSTIRVKGGTLVVQGGTVTIQ